MAPVRSVGREDGFHGWGPASVGPVRGEGAPLAPSPAAAGLAAPPPSGCPVARRRESWAPETANRERRGALGR